ncbi:MAG: Ig-like domain-containing protein [Firmicutes bacterium]|nr:Ig-like domain-containing protein [Alicyclobacillaceae bacterium]MCL6497030.1 Ig-like domain-containing protein [Bacillota bacterium]
MAGSAVVTVNVPQTGHESGTYVVPWPALPPGTPELQPITMQWLGVTGQHHLRNTIPVTYTANAPIFSRTPHGPWVSTLDLPPATPAWIRLPVDQAGLTVTEIPHFHGHPYANGTEYSLPPVGIVRLVAQEAAAGNPSPNPSAGVGHPALAVQAPARAEQGHPIPITVTVMENGKPVASQAVTLTASAGQLAASTVATDAQGQAEDTLSGAPPGTVTVTAQALGAQGSARIQVAAVAAAASTGPSAHGGGSGREHSGPGFPWWLVLILAVAVAVLVLGLVRRRRNRAGKATEASDP